MTSITESFDAWKPNGQRIQIVVNHKWDADNPATREDREAFCLRHGFILPTDSCAVACVMAAHATARHGWPE